MLVSNTLFWIWISSKNLQKVICVSDLVTKLVNLFVFVKIFMNNQVKLMFSKEIWFRTACYLDLVIFDTQIFFN